MSDAKQESAGVQAQYAVRVAEDLENNRKEQERIGNEVATLQEQLQELEADHAVLLSMQQALGSPAADATAKKAAPRKAVPAPRTGKNNSTAARAKKPAAAKPAAAKAKDKPAAKDKDKAAKSTPKAAAKKPAAPAAGPTLVELIDNHLGQQKEPRSAAEITTALAKARPDRALKTTVVRTTVEGLVAKGRAVRTKQGSSVFYTAAAPADSSAAPKAEAAAG
ncbi:hypothetical protein GCM10010277_06930 [Streptomyces longisporoflavus]|uniref:hypothetical protein n=1 Tax=Streptomyces longisporoflavus TaxID=28044 RepID=UPI00167D6289|nr:hypothetical protein [Streptomyces longisporoflavus]GGV25765.1 hypothetical protein GCM10010277_06930 [Streptomyces longisporoflavus]